MLNFRPFEYTDHDYERALGCYLAEWPDSGTRVQDWKHHDVVRPKKYYFNHLVIEKDGELAGSAAYHECWWNTEPKQYGIVWTLHPDIRTDELDTICYQHLLGALQGDREIHSLIIESREDKLPKLRLVEREGFRRISRGPRSELQVDEFDRAPFAGLINKLESGGIRFANVEALMKTDSEWQRKLWDLDWIFGQDEPRPDTPTRQPFEEYVQNTLESPSFSPQQWFVAVDGERYVGFSQLLPNHNNPDLLNTGWTGVDRPYRRRGVAKALKLHAIDCAKRQGIKRITTENEETNPMYQINMQLGFKPKAAWVTYRKDFVEVETENGD